MVQTVQPSSSQSPIPERLRALRARMAERNIDAVIVRSTDKYLNEYVSSDDSTREWITGFTGSMGDALITRDRAVLIVDGRYTLQASQEAPEFLGQTITLGTSIEQAWLKLLDGLPAQGVRTLGIESERVSQQLFEQIEKRVTPLGLTVTATAPSLIEETRAALTLRAGTERPEAGVLGGGPGSGSARPGEGLATAPRAVWAIDSKLSGRTVTERLALGHALLESKQLDALLVVALDEIAWITNLRGTHFPFQATFRSTALVGKADAVVALGAGPRPSAEAGVVFVDDIGAAVGRFGMAPKIGYDARATPAAVVQALKHKGATLVEVESPYAMARTQKTPQELAHMVAAFERADRVVDAVQRWVNSALDKKQKITEADVAQKTEELFKQSGAFGLSFKVISAAGKNGAVIHYSTPDSERVLKKGELFLLDTGAYYEGGYATDLTRTFLLGGKGVRATAEQKRLFTLVLKGAIAGMSAVLPKGVVGEQLDSLVRAPLWQHGLDYGHGTGHGVGVNVHESPPRVSVGSRVPIEIGQVFSIEPGVYLPDWGGVRIENLCTLVDDTRPIRKGVPRTFVRVKPLTFSPLDARLIDARLLTPYERRFLRWFRGKKTKGTALPPVG